MPRLKLSPEGEIWREELDALFPGKLILTLAEVQKALGRGETSTRAWLRENDIPYVVMTLPSGKQVRRGYPKREIAAVLGKHMRRGWSS